MFQLHPRLAADTVIAGRFKLSLCLLVNDARYPWCILVPQREGISEIYQLPEDDQYQLQRESSRLAEAMMTLFTADKMNLAALGNLVPQLHLHHVARYRDDAAWPGPIWGVGDSQPYTPEQIEQRLGQIHGALPELIMDGD